jgi:hypothetical protein
MGRVDAPALHGTWLGQLLRLLAPIMRAVLSSPLHPFLSRWFLLFSWTGARTGTTYTIPLSYIEDDGVIWVTTGDAWWRRAVLGRKVTVRLRGRPLPVSVVAVSDSDESVREHGRLFRAHPWFRILAGIPAARGGGPEEASVRRAVVAGRTLLRVEGGE